MELSNDLLTQFAKTVTNEINTKSETTLYGTITEQNGSKYVKLDGSDQVTPIFATVGVKDKDRVMVTIKNHTATVVGNMTSPSANGSDVSSAVTKISEFETLLADKVSTSELNTEIARIDTLEADNATIKNTLTATEADIDAIQADNVTIKNTLTANSADIETLKTTTLTVNAANAKYATIENLDATNADIHNLESDYGDFKVLATDRLAADKASIEALQTDKLDTETAAITYANIDFSNIDKATMESFYSNSGLIKDVTIGDGTITGELNGVTINGNLIKADTIVADKLVLQGVDGLYYKLNTDGTKTEADQTEYNSLKGDIFMAKSIAATKISVSDLVAFGATIGGFKITTDSIYSGVKETVGNTTRGIYLDDDGQVALGDSTSYVMFYKDSDDSYKLDISANSITFGSSKQNVETVITEISNDILAWCYNNDKTYINGNKIYAGTITTTQLATDSIKSLNYVANSTGSFLNLADGSFDSKYLKWDAEGNLISNSGYIGGIEINQNGLSSSSTSSGGVTVGYSITNSGAITVKNIGSGRDSLLYLNSDYLSMESYSTASGGDPLCLSMSSSGIFMGQTSGDYTAKVYNNGGGVLYLYGASSVTCQSNMNAQKNITSTGYIMPKSGQYIHTANGTSGTSGYVKIAQIKVTGTYTNQPIVIEYARRGDYTSTNLFIRFASANNTDPSLSMFRTDSSYQNAYLYKSATSTWDLYIQKSEAYDTIDILSYYAGSYSRDRITMTWKNEMATSLPSGYTTVNSYMRSMNYKFGNDKESFITARTGGGFDFWFTTDGVRICFDSSGKIYRVTADGTWTALTS